MGVETFLWLSNIRYCLKISKGSETLILKILICPKINISI